MLGSLIKGIGFCNFRSFDDSGVVLGDLGQINILIGKNNSGKSNVLRAILSLAKKFEQGGRGEPDLIEKNCGNNSKSKLIVHLDVSNLLRQRGMEHLTPCAKNGLRFTLTWSEIEILQCDDLNVLVEQSASGGSFYSKLLIFQEKLIQTGWTGRPSEEQLRASIFQLFRNVIFNGLQELLKTLIYIPSFRRATAGNEDAEKFHYDGAAIISKLGVMRHPDPGHDKEQARFFKIQESIRELLGVKDLELEVGHNKDKLILDIDGIRRDLSDFGTGVHELVLFCSAMEIYQNCLFCIEEPELYLHPQLQRKFMKFLERSSNSYFITTHSNTLLDCSAQAHSYHVQHRDKRSVIDKALNAEASSMILDDLGYRASDLLQSNGIVWVEGPSDRIYLKKWFSLLFGETYIEGIHYSILFYGGKLLSHYAAKFDELTNMFVPMLKINRNAFVIMDRDSLTSDACAEDHKVRIRAEIGDGQCWITSGREIENYLTEASLRAFLKEKYDKDIAIVIDKEQHVTETLELGIKAAGERSFRYDSRKVEFSKLISNHFKIDDLNYLDLRERLDAVHKAISSWNESFDNEDV